MIIYLRLACSYINLLWAAISTSIYTDPIYIFSFEDVLGVHERETKDKTKRKIHWQLYI